MKIKKLTGLTAVALICCLALTGCGSSDFPATLTPDQVAAQREQTAQTIAKIQASKGTPQQKAQAIGALTANTPIPKS